jgi:hypothetical protein
MEAHFAGGETFFFPPILMVLVTSQGFHGDKTKKPGGLGELGQINPPTQRAFLGSGLREEDSRNRWACRRIKDKAESMPGCGPWKKPVPTCPAWKLPTMGLWC